MVVAKDIQEKTGYKEKDSYELKGDFGEIYDAIEKEMTADQIMICFNKIVGEIKYNEKHHPYWKFSETKQKSRK